MRRKLVKIFLCIVIIGSLINVGCSRKSDYKEDSTTPMVDSSYDNLKDNSGDLSSSSIGDELNTTNDVNVESDTSTTDKATDGSVQSEEKAITNGTSIVSTANQVDDSTNRKLIKIVSLDLETLDYDLLIQKLDQDIKKYKGYVEDSTLSGNKYFSEEDQRYSTMVVRIPKDHMDEFVNEVSKDGNVVNKEEKTEDVTLDYVDVESHNKSLKIEEERLLELVKKAEKLEDIITLETKLSEIRYEIEANESQIRTYNNLVEYSTVNLTITEVKKITEVSAQKKSVSERIHEGYDKNIEKCRDKAQDFFVWFVINLPYIVALLTIAIVILVICKKKMKLKKENKDGKNNNKNDNNNNGNNNNSLNE
ncbi:DUF4349 domain-containing protein [Anaeromicropila herbilytica]|uniref:DUF4349 domain-containing protein n=1 Tax=Anaeromicropila herbilytica TaxID=2785025 RepID=A0A7R7ID73_9FIRM|nr:DUF4349 domain-containing protein [Anaeromicropila herbilytica]BCN31473.1 hypothetical protein bsdtb5_27680 [Anaeromicropila herbilytica]